MAAPAWAYAQAKRTAAPEALGSSQLVPRRLPPTALSDAPPGLDRRRVARRFASALRDPVSSAAPVADRARWWEAQSAQQVALAFQDRPVVLSSQSTESKSRSFA